MLHAAHATRAVHGTMRADLAMLARKAAPGDTRACPALVHRLDGVLHGVVRRYRLTPADVDDVVQTTWLRAVTHLTHVHDPGAIERLPARRRRLMCSLLVHTSPTCAQPSRTLGMPIGSIDPKRERAFARLRRDNGLAWFV
jgi:hypothetical protein